MNYFSRTMQMGDNGRVVIPKEVREVINANSGDDIIFQVANGQVTITTRAALVKRLEGIFAMPGAHDVTEEFLQERREEAKRKW